jgi:hypothetical protein
MYRAAENAVKLKRSDFPQQFGASSRIIGIRTAGLH